MKPQQVANIQIDYEALDRAVEEFKRNGARTVREVEQHYRSSFQIPASARGLVMR